ncbi:MAG: radical SAM protein [Nitrospirota bacterium]
MSKNYQPTVPKLIAWEVTRSCVLNCIHCRAAAKYGPYPDELTTEECLRFLDDVVELYKTNAESRMPNVETSSSIRTSTIGPQQSVVNNPPIIILTGGEPMMREDIYEIAKYGTEKGLRMVMAPCGLMVTEETAKKIKESGIKRISLSIDGATAESHDAFRRVDGAFDAVMKAVESCKKVGLEFQVNTTITKYNVKEVPAILDLVVRLGAVAYHPFLLVPTGRGKDLADQEISPEEYEKVLTWIYEQREKASIQFKPTCAPHYYRIFRQKEREKGRSVSPQIHGLDAMTKGCMGGQSFAFVSHTGKVQICGFLEEEAGDIRKEPFSEIWKESKLFNEMRDIDHYHGKCGICEYRKVCSGCRARAYALTGDYLGEEPYCTYIPQSIPIKAKL